MKSWLCSLGFLVAFAPLVAAAGPTYDVHPHTFKANNATSVVFSVRLDSLAVFDPRSGRITFTVVGAPVTLGTPGQVFVNATAQPLLFSATAVVNTVTIDAADAADFFSLEANDVIWVQVPITAGPTTASVLAVVYSGHGSFDGGTAANDTIAFVDFDFAPPGPPGPAGAAGAPGQSVTTQSEPAGTNCPAGGVRIISVNTTSFVCNGAAGPAGSSGFPKGGILLLAPGSPAPTGFTFVGAFGGFQAWRKN